MSRFLFPFILCLFFGSHNLLAQCNTGEVTFEVNITPDQYPAETSWELSDESGTIIHSGDTTNFSACVSSSGCLVFTIFDAYGDGICCAYGQGSYELLIDGQQVASGGQFGYNESTTVDCSPGMACSEPITGVLGINTADGINTWYEFVPPTSGNYTLNTCLPGNACGNTTLYIYDYCAGLDWDDSNVATMSYSDTDCNGQLSSLGVVLNQGQIYYIRIRYESNICAGSSIDWELSYGGVIAGCMDQTACNYNPNATVDDGSCIYPGDPQCPTGGPDLVIEEGVLTSSLYLTTLANNDQCFIQEGCLTGYGDRDIIRFTTHINNIGNADYYIGQPPATTTTPNPDWEWDPCHNHWHYEGYAEYVMYDMDDGTEIPIGFKNGFCVMDLTCDGGNYQYDCGNQGISAACGDIYSSGLDCQWVDITDVPAGLYMLVVRVNWDFSPDALGREELDYNNNWAQVCLNITRNINTDVPSFTIDPNCQPYVDCQGTPYGNAEYDCNGDCAGAALKGDIYSDTVRTLADYEVYLQEALLDTINASECLDLNADGEITVTDAALLFDCLRHSTGPIPPDHQHTPCQFPYAIQNPNDEAVLTMARINEGDQYFEIDLKNPTGRILSFEFDFSGVTIDYVQNLIPGYIADIEFDDNEIIGNSYDESNIGKSNDFIPFLRVYYTEITETEICIPAITDFVNHFYEEMAHSIETACIIPAVVGINDLEEGQFGAEIIPNPASKAANLVYQNAASSKLSLAIYDITGKQVFSKESITEGNVELPIKDFSAGVYIYKLNDGEETSVGRFVVK